MIKSSNKIHCIIYYFLVYVPPSHKVLSNQFGTFWAILQTYQPTKQPTDAGEDIAILVEVIMVWYYTTINADPNYKIQNKTKK